MTRAPHAQASGLDPSPAPHLLLLAGGGLAAGAAPRLGAAGALGPAGRLGQAALYQLIVELLPLDEPGGGDTAPGESPPPRARGQPRPAASSRPGQQRGPEPRYLEELRRLGMVPAACDELRFCPASDSSSSERLAAPDAISLEASASGGGPGLSAAPTEAAAGPGRGAGAAPCSTGASAGTGTAPGRLRFRDPPNWSKAQACGVPNPLPRPGDNPGARTHHSRQRRLLLRQGRGTTSGSLAGRGATSGFSPWAPPCCPAQLGASLGAAIFLWGAAGARKLRVATAPARGSCRGAAPRSCPRHCHSNLMQRRGNRIITMATGLPEHPPPTRASLGLQVASGAPPCGAPSCAAARAPGGSKRGQEPPVTPHTHAHTGTNTRLCARTRTCTPQTHACGCRQRRRHAHVHTHTQVDAHAQVRRHTHTHRHAHMPTHRKECASACTGVGVHTHMHSHQVHAGVRTLSGVLSHPPPGLTSPVSGPHPLPHPGFPAAGSCGGRSGWTEPSGLHLLMALAPLEPPRAFSPGGAGGRDGIAPAGSARCRGHLLWAATGAHRRFHGRGTWPATRRRGKQQGRGAAPIPGLCTPRFCCRPLAQRACGWLWGGSWGEGGMMTSA